MPSSLVGYGEVELENGRVAVYPLHPFGPGYVVDEATHIRYRRTQAIAGSLVFVAITLVQRAWILLPLTTTLYAIMLWLILRGRPKTPAASFRTWVELWSGSRSVAFSVFAIVGCFGFGAVGVWMLVVARTPSVVALGGLVILMCALATYVHSSVLLAQMNRKRRPR